jgi:Mrp family chromosome partitioning ATPase
MTRPDAQTTGRADWMAARAALAARRLRPLLPLLIAAYGVVFVALLLAGGSLGGRRGAPSDGAKPAVIAEPDTRSIVDEVEMARAAFAQRDSALQRAITELAVRPDSVLPPGPAQQARDSLNLLLTQLDAALDRTVRAPLAASYRALARTTALRSLASARALADSLTLLEDARRALDPVEAPQREFANMIQRVNAVGASLQAIARSRHLTLSHQRDSVISSAMSAAAAGATLPDTGRLRAARDSAARRLSSADSIQATASRVHSVAQTDTATHRQWPRMLGVAPGVVALSGLLSLLVLAFTIAVAVEIRTPTLAHAKEAERLSGLPVIATAHTFRVPRDGRARLQPGVGVDPVRMVYLSLTTHGARERMVCVTGDEATQTVVVAGGLAVSAAAEERATLVMDLSPGAPSAAAYFGWRDEPGFTEAIAGVRLWREVARPIGASEGLNLDVVPAGLSRADAEEAENSDAARRAFREFLEEYDFSVLVAPTQRAVIRAHEVGNAKSLIVVARSAHTKHSTFKATIAAIRETDIAIHGIVLL